MRSSRPRLSWSRVWNVSTRRAYLAEPRDGDQPVDLWVNDAGCLVTDPIPDAERLPGRYVVPGLVDAHAHPAVGREAGMPVALSGSAMLNVLAAWADSGVCLVRDAGSPGGSVLTLDLVPAMPRLQAAGRFLAPAGRYFPALLPEEAPQHQLTELALGELARGARWVKVIADFPAIADGVPSGPPGLTYPKEAVTAMVAAVHAAGGRVAAMSRTCWSSQTARDSKCCSRCGPRCPAASAIGWQL